MNFFQKFLKGHISLPVTFWVFGVVAYMVFGLIKLAFFFSLIVGEMAGDIENFNVILMDMEKILKAALASPFLLGFLIFEFIYSVFASIGIWRASTVYKEEEGGETIWAVLAKIAVVFGWLNYIIKYATSTIAL